MTSGGKLELSLGPDDEEEDDEGPAENKSQRFLMRKFDFE